MQNNQIVSVGLPLPLYQTFDYLCSEPLQIGDRVLVSWGKKTVVGIVLAMPETTNISSHKLKPILQRLVDIDPLPPETMELIFFVARYYQQPIGMVAHMALPKSLRSEKNYLPNKKGTVPEVVAKAIRKLNSANFGIAAVKGGDVPSVEFNPDQKAAMHTFYATAGSKPLLLHGVTGSGKTEVYLEMIRSLRDSGKQTLLLVPEINLTPQLIKNVAQRLFPDLAYAPVAQLHSHLTDHQRLQNWLAITLHQAKVIVGTRLSIFTPFADLGLIIIDEEHDPSYRQQDNTRYSARDMAIWLAKKKNIPIVLGSATPSLETWHNAQIGRYAYVSMPSRVQNHPMPTIELIPIDAAAQQSGITDISKQAIADTLEQGQQVLIFINRRGFSPIMICPSCTWKSGCNRCSSFMVLHKHGKGYQLKCHHCSRLEFLPASCPQCGNTDLQPLGVGTQRAEEYLREQFPLVRTIRIDADSTGKKGEAERLFTEIHTETAQIIIGTQMVAKGHDFKNVALVVIINADNSLYSQNFRAAEYLFAQLMQVSGRAGRGFGGARVFLQTMVPEHIVYQALRSHHYETFATYELTQRQLAQLPPYSFQALLRAESRNIEDAFDFLRQVVQYIRQYHSQSLDGLRVSPPMAHSLLRVANMERAQLLIEADTRQTLSHFLQLVVYIIPQITIHKRITWFVDVDPIEGAI